MSFLSPWFFLGLLAVGAPLVAHLRRLSVKNRIAFSAMDFLEPIPPRKARQRWEDIALMIARMGALGLLAFAFARPYVKKSGPVSGVTSPEYRRLVVLLDTSASMRRNGFFSEARDSVRQIASSLTDSDEFELLGFDRIVFPILSFEVWRRTPAGGRPGLLNETLARTDPGWAQTELDGALKFVADRAARDAMEEPIEVVVVSDLQEGSRLAKLQALPWPKNLQVRVVQLPLRTPVLDDALSLHWLPPDAETASTEAPIKIQVSAAPGFQGDRVKLVIDGPHAREWTVPVSAGKTRSVTVPGPAFDFGYVRVAGASDFVSGVWVSRLPQKRALVALGHTGDLKDPSSTRYFVHRAVNALSAALVEAVGGDNLAPERDADVVLWMSNAAASPEWNMRMRRAVEKGAIAILTLEEGSRGAAVGALFGEVWDVNEAPVSDFAMLGEMDRMHPVFAPFKTPQFSDFSGVRFWHYRRVVFPKDSSTRVLARFEGGDPALIECALGKGRIYVWTSDWRPHDAQWVLSSRCVPFLAGCLEMAAGGRAPFLVATPGESFALPEGTTGLRGSDGAVFSATGARATLDMPGVFVIEPSGGVAVVNVAREEGRLAALSPEKLKNLGVPMAKPNMEERQSGGGSPPSAELLLAAEIEAQQGGWRWLLGAVLALLTLETWWAARLSSASKHPAL